MTIGLSLTEASYFKAAANSIAALSTVMPCLMIRSHRHFSCFSQYEFAKSRRPGTESSVELDGVTTRGPSKLRRVSRHEESIYRKNAVFNQDLIVTIL